MEEYTFNLLENLFSLDKKNNYILFFNSFSDPKINFDRWKKYPNVRLKILRIPNKILNFLFWFFHWPKIDRLLGGVDILFLPNIIFSAASRETKLLLTVHDLSFERYPEYFSLKRRLWHFLINTRSLCRKADQILTVSQSSKRDLEELYKINESKIKVIYSAVSDKFSPLNRNDLKFIEIKKKYDLPYKFILYLGTIEPRKNIIALIRAFNQLRKQNHHEIQKYKLVITGERGWKHKKIFEEMKDSEFAKDIIFAGFIDPEDKPYVYNLASLFVYPSFFEGFGFPPLEAMSCGVPVITSNNSSLPEIAGKAGIMIDPDRPQELFEAIREVLISKDLQIKLKQKSLAQAKKFSWHKTAEEVLKTIERS